MDKLKMPSHKDTRDSKDSGDLRDTRASRDSRDFPSDVRDSRKGSEADGASRILERERNMKYHVYVRLPFNRPEDFVDPPPVDWNDDRSDELWSSISGVAATAEIKWEELAARFDVTVEYLLQMASYLTQRHTEQLRAQMRKATAIKGSPSPVPGSDSAGPPSAGLMQPSAMGFPPLAAHNPDVLRRAATAAAAAAAATGASASGPSSSRAPSALSIRKDSPLPRNDGSVPGTPVSRTPSLAVRPTTSRNSSHNGPVGPANPVVAARNISGTSRAGDIPGQLRHRLSSLPTAPPAAANTTAGADYPPEPASPDPADSQSSHDSSSSSSSPVQSRIIRRPPRFQPQDSGPDADDEDDEAEPAFLSALSTTQPGSGAGQDSRQSPSSVSGSGASSATSTTSAQDMGATLRGDPRDVLARGAFRQTSQQRQQQRQKLSQDSLASSSAASSFSGGGVSAMTPQGLARVAAASGRSLSSTGAPISPRRTMELAGSAKGRGVSREGSDGGTRSMGSSFSDLDDASVTQSAMEEALASRMQDGTIGSRMSTLGNAIKSRYLPKGNRQ